MSVDGSVGVGPTTFWDFSTSKRSILGIHAAYRQFSGERSLTQLGYGLVLLHYLADDGSLNETSGWYVNYGLLLQVVRIKGVPASGTAHDTKLSLGYDFGQDQHWFMEAALHYSRLRYFKSKEINVDYAELAVGCRIF